MKQQLCNLWHHNTYYIFSMSFIWSCWYSTIHTKTNQNMLSNVIIFVIILLTDCVSPNLPIVIDVKNLLLESGLVNDFIPVILDHSYHNVWEETHHKKWYCMDPDNNVGENSCRGHEQFTWILSLNLFIVDFCKSKFF